MKNLETKVEEIQHLLFEARSLVKICALASDSCITDKELQLRDNLEIYEVLRKVNLLLANIELILYS